MSSGLHKQYGDMFFIYCCWYKYYFYVGGHTRLLLGENLSLLETREQKCGLGNAIKPSLNTEWVVNGRHGQNFERTTALSIDTALQLVIFRMQQHNELSFKKKVMEKCTAWVVGSSMWQKERNISLFSVWSQICSKAPTLLFQQTRSFFSCSSKF